LSKVHTVYDSIINFGPWRKQLCIGCTLTWVTLLSPTYFSFLQMLNVEVRRSSRKTFVYFAMKMSDSPTGKFILLMYLNLNNEFLTMSKYEEKFRIYGKMKIKRSWNNSFTSKTIVKLYCSKTIQIFELQCLKIKALA
jgi:hypothetical protein